MKTQRRHELQTNVLADWLGQQIEQLRPYSKTIVAVIAVVLAVAAISGFFVNYQAAQVSAGWSDFFAASFDQKPGRLGQVAAQHAGTDAGLWALLGEADLEQAEGLKKLFINREEAIEHFKNARSGYEGVNANAEGDPELKRAALFGLAQVHEAQNELDTAIDYYEQVAQQYSASEIGREAQERVKLLKSKDVKQFYDWFAKAEPVPPPTGPPEGFDFSNLQGGLPETPNMPLPSTEATDGDGSETSPPGDSVDDADPAEESTGAPTPNAESEPVPPPPTNSSDTNSSDTNSSGDDD